MEEDGESLQGCNMAIAEYPAQIVARCTEEQMNYVVQKSQASNKTKAQVLRQMLDFAIETDAEFYMSNDQVCTKKS